MSKDIKSTIHAQDMEITVISSVDKEDYISLTDIAKYRSDDPYAVIHNWMRNRDTIEYLGLWEQLNNPDFNPIEFEGFKQEAGKNAFAMSPTKWIKATNAIGLISKSGRYGGGTFAHRDIAFEFASWISPEFKLYIIKDYQRLKEDETHRHALDWNVKRIISKANYRIHTDAIKRNLIPEHVSKQQQGYVYASEADLLNVALFGMTASAWRQENPDAEGNIRDYATIEQLLVLSNMESANALLIEQNMTQGERLERLNRMAISQMEAISGSKSAKELNDIYGQPQLPEK